MKLRLAAAFAVITSSATAQEWSPSPAAEQQLNSERDECWQRVHSKIYSTVEQVTTCENAAWHAYMLATNFPWMDLEDRSEAEKLEHARLADERRISVRQEMLLDDETDARFQNEMNRRVAATLKYRADAALRAYQEMNQRQASPAATESSQPYFPNPSPPPTPPSYYCTQTSSGEVCTPY